MGKGDKFLKWLGVKPEVEEEYDSFGERMLPAYEAEPSTSQMQAQSPYSSGSSNLVGLQGGNSSGKQQVRVIVSEPDSFNDAQPLADHLKNRRQIILNLENTAPDVSQRIIDFLSGTLYALDGTSQQLGKYIFLFAPSNTEITKENRIPIKKPGALLNNPAGAPMPFNPGGGQH